MDDIEEPSGGSVRRFHSLLPKEAQRILRDSVRPRKREGKVQRELRVQEAIARVKSEYPQFFRSKR